MTTGDVKAMVQSALSGISAPVSYITRRGKASADYFTFFILSDNNAAWGDGKSLAHGAHVQLDGWSTGDMDDLCEDAKSKMISAGFIYEFGRDLYEPDTKTFHRVQQFYICKEE